MSTAGILEIEDLKKITQLQKAGDIERVLSAQGIKVFRGRGGVVWTTLALINAAGGIKPATDNDFYNVDDVIG